MAAACEMGFQAQSLRELGRPGSVSMSTVYVH